ncbi:phosphotransferase [Paenibacillus sp. FSL W7-1287]|uniref:phosphotransferase n=1 Tax=Paenibacillus sp. FSL W7-1287 TaxID=2954538 RepID=UPI0030F737EF
MEGFMSAELEQLLGQYAWHGQPRIIPGLSGMNNTTIFLEDEQERSIIRIYNNHADQQKLMFEHQMLQALQKQTLTIATPVPVINRMGSAVSKLQNGKLAARYRYIEGERPSVANAKQLNSLAEATAKLSIALSQVELSEVPAYSPYYQLAHNYLPLDEPTMLHLLGHEEIAQLEEQLLLIQQERGQLEELEHQLSKLPHQWIHGDINCSNALAVQDNVIAILDFEFVTRDLRAMELAVLLSELIKPNIDEVTAKLLSMQKAYVSIVALTDSELALLPELIKLRSVDVVMHFIERFMQGIDPIGIVVAMIKNAAYTITFVNEQMK